MVKITDRKNRIKNGEKKTYRLKKAQKRKKQGYDVYDEKTKHWARVDPKTGKFLKSSKHPTLHKEIDWYKSKAGESFRKEHKLVTKGPLGRERKYYKYKKRK